MNLSLRGESGLDMLQVSFLLGKLSNTIRR
jgi:hypothetical protein